MRATGVVAIGVTGLLAMAGCTSEHGALPPPDPNPTVTESAVGQGRAAAALLTAEDLPPGYVEVESDVTARWTELMEQSEHTVALRPDCGPPFAAVSDRVPEIPEDSAGAAFAEADGDNGNGDNGDNENEIVQFVAALDPGIGEVLVGDLADTHSRCDSYSLPTPDRGALAISVQPLDLSGLPDGDDVDVTVWQRTIISSTLRRTDVMAAYRAGDIAGLLSVVADQHDSGDQDGGDPDSDEDRDDDEGRLDTDEEQTLAELITAAVQHAQEAGR